MIVSLRTEVNCTDIALSGIGYCKAFGLSSLGIVASAAYAVPVCKMSYPTVSTRRVDGGSVQR